MRTFFVSWAQAGEIDAEQSKNRIVTSQRAARLPVMKEHFDDGLATAGTIVSRR